MKKWIILLLCIGAAVLFYKGGKTSEKPDIEAKSAVLMDGQTGEILFEMNGGLALPPASMSKLMTEYIVLDRINAAALDWSDKVIVSNYAASVIGAQMDLQKGETVSIEDLFAGLTIQSANDAAVALAEHLAGSEELFAQEMNETAQEIKLSNTAHFINASGLTRLDLGTWAPKTIQGETGMSAKDAAKLAFRLISDFPELLNFTKRASYAVNIQKGKLLTNTNWMIEGNKMKDKYVYDGLDGLKTGYTQEAGYCFTATAIRNNHRLITVVMGTATDAARFEETRKLLDYGFKLLERNLHK